MNPTRVATPHVGYSVSYRNKWWGRRWYACGNVIESEARTIYDELIRRGFRRVRIEVKGWAWG